MTQYSPSGRASPKDAPRLESTRCTGKGAPVEGAPDKASLYFKTELCAFFVRGTCAKGSGCTWAHDLVEIQHRPALDKTKLCAAVRGGGICRAPACRYAHSRDEVRRMARPRKPPRADSAIEAQRPSLGDAVLVVDARHGNSTARAYAGKTGNIITDDQSEQPYEISGMHGWFHVDEVAPAKAGAEPPATDSLATQHQFLRGTSGEQQSEQQCPLQVPAAPPPPSELDPHPEDVVEKAQAILSSHGRTQPWAKLPSQQQDVVEKAQAILSSHGRTQPWAKLPSEPRVGLSSDSTGSPCVSRAGSSSHEDSPRDEERPSADLWFGDAIEPYFLTFARGSTHPQLVAVRKSASGCPEIPNDYTAFVDLYVQMVQESAAAALQRSYAPRVGDVLRL